MAVCKKCGYNNPDDARYCGKCKEELMGVDPAVMKANMDRVNEEFENDARATLDVSRLTFICDVCGKVNPINVPGKRCARCGKKMPRSAYLKAVRKMQKAGYLAPPTDTASLPLPQPVVQQAPVAPPQPVVEESFQEEPQAQPAQQIYRMSARPQPPQQNGQVIQPFVIVPYVSQSQPVYQYHPNTVYKYTEYSAEEKKQNQEALLRYQKERKEAELQRIEAEEEQKREIAKKQAMLRKKTLKMARRSKAPQAPGYTLEPKSNVRISAIFSLLFAVAAIFVLFFLEVLVPTLKIGDVTLTFAMHEGLTGSNMMFNYVQGLINQTAKLPVDIGGWLVLGGSAAFALMMLLSAIQSIIRIIKGHSTSKALVLPIFALLSTIVAYVGYAFRGGAFDINAFVALWPNYIYCAVIMVFVPVIMILIAALTRKEEKY